VPPIELPPGYEDHDPYTGLPPGCAEVPGVYMMIDGLIKTFEEQKVKILSALLFTSSLDRNRNNLSVVEWAIQKTGKSYKLTPEDFEPIANLTLKEILELM
jgi:hypothetical protein